MPERDVAATRAFIALAGERFKKAAESETKTRKECLDDLEFSIGEQWPEGIKTAREADGRPCITVNRIPASIKIVTNQQREQRPSIQINPVGDGADVEIAEIIQGIVRHVDVRSDAEVAYDTAFDLMVRGGYGAWRIVTEYVNEDSFDQEICIQPIQNPFTVYMDPYCAKLDKSDAMFGFVIEDLSKELYKVKHPGSTAAGLVDFTSIGDHPLQEGLEKNTIRVAEYFYVEHKKGKLLALADGTTMDSEEYLKEFPDAEQVPPEKKPAMDAEGQPKTRPTLKRIVKWAKINAMEILEERTLPGTHIPIVLLLGDTLNVNGKRHIAGLVRHAKDPSRVYNYQVSAAIETSALAPKAPHIGAAGQFAGFEKQWEAANVKNTPYLEYNPVDVNGKPIGPPARQQFEPPIQAMMELVRQADNDFKVVTGIFDASLGQRGPDESGKAILARQKQTDVSTLNWVDNLSRSLRLSGRIELEYIPVIYDVPQVKRIIKPDGTVDHVGIYNSQKHDVETAQAALQEHFDSGLIKKIYDIGVGTYDVVVSVGPSHDSKRQEAVQSIMALVQSYPQMMAAAGDLLVRQMDWPGAKEIADRLKKLLPPQLQDDGDNDPQQMAMKLQAQLQALSENHAAVVKALQEATDIIKTKRVEQDGKLSIAKLEQETKIAVAEITTNAQSALERAKYELDVWKELHGAAHETALAAIPPRPPSGDDGSQGGTPPAAAAPTIGGPQPMTPAPAASTPQQ